jgi:glycosyltransferase involved in cell wall biosynthesis
MSSAKPKVSVVIPVYNGSNYLRESIGSALAQTYDNIEVIVVNDGSNDSGQTELIAKSFGERIRYFYKDNGGVASALNVGIKEMTGDYFAWLSHDDIYLPQNIEIQINTLNKNPSYAISFCDTDVFNESKDYLFNRLFDNTPIKTTSVQGAFSFFKMWIYACSLLIHRSCFDKVGLLNERLRTAQDVDITIRLLANFDALHIDLPLALRRDHAESGFNMMRQAVSVEFDNLVESYIVEKGLDFFFPNLVSSNRIAKAYNELANHLLHKSDNLPRIYYERSISSNFSLLNPALFKKMIGINATKILYRCRHSLMYRIHKFIGKRELF